MQINAFAFCLCLSAAIAPSTSIAQDTGEPLSAIEWLSDVVRDPTPQIAIQPQSSDEDVATSASVVEVTTTALGQLKLDAVGILPRATTGLPADFWSRSSAKQLSAELRNLRSDLPPPLAQFLTTLLLAELPAPADSADGAEMFLARVDKFLETGALDQAQALIRRAGTTRPALFGRWFDVSLLTGQEDLACRSMLQNPSIAPTYPARIFCLARAGDWDAAALTLGTGETLGVMTDKEVALISRFLDPELFEGQPLLAIPDRITPLSFQMHAAIGEPLSIGGLPHAFAYSNLSDNEGWKTRISAAERLTRTGAVPPETLFALYAERTPAASGGVWDRVEAVQAFETALTAGDPRGISTHLPRAMRSLRSAGLEHAFAQVYGPQLTKFPLSQDATKDATRAALLSKDYELVANSEPPRTMPALWRTIATGQLDGQTSEDALEEAIIAGFTAQQPPQQFEALLKDRRLGEAVIQAIGLMADGPRSDPADIERGLGLLTQLGLNDVARQTALHMLLTRPRA